jgi:hypothetical protein
VEASHELSLTGFNWSMGICRFGEAVMVVFG